MYLPTKNKARFSVLFHGPTPVSYTHLFREGNGRTQRVFLSQLARHAGYVIDFARVDPDDLMIATIQAAGGVDDFLKVLFDEMVV